MAMLKSQNNTEVTSTNLNLQSPCGYEETFPENHLQRVPQNITTC